MLSLGWVSAAFFGGALLTVWLMTRIAAVSTPSAAQRAGTARTSSPLYARCPAAGYAIRICEFTGESTYNHQAVTPDRVWAEQSGGSWELGGGLPVQGGVFGCGFIVHGMDEQGNDMSFRAYIDMTDAPR